jgi:hypothetical protein
MKKTPPRKLPFAVTARERDILLKHTLGLPYLDAVRQAKPQGREFVILLTLSEIDGLAGFVAGDANHSTGNLQDELGEIYDRLDSMTHRGPPS